MNAFFVALLFFAGALGATLFGFLLRNKLPEHHVSEHSRSVIVLSTKLVATMTALLLGLLVSSANDSLQSFSSGLEQMGARLATTDRLLKDYGPETREVRQGLREHTALSVAVIWPEERENLVALKLLVSGQVPKSGWDGAVRDASHAVRALAITSFLPDIEGKLLDLKPQGTHSAGGKPRPCASSGCLLNSIGCWSKRLRIRCRSPCCCFSSPGCSSSLRLSGSLRRAMQP